jgi:radical SAM superfamily enzyme YgiQ (UPF0313 family)
VKVLLANTPDFFPAPIKWGPPPGILYLGAVLERAGYDIRIIDPVFERLSKKSFVDRVVKESPDVFGLSVLSDTYFTAAELFRAVKQKLPRVITIAGGPHPTLLAGELLHNLSELDLVLQGEGEYVLPETLARIRKGESLHGLPNISFRQDGQIIKNHGYQLIPDLDSLPFPAYHLVDYDRYDFSSHVSGKGEVRAIQLITSRGCPYDCQFCSNTNLSLRHVRYRSAENIVEEMKLWMNRYNLKFFWILDDAFNLSVKRVLNFCDLLEKEKLDVNWCCVMRADNASRELLERMKQTGFVGANFAVETTDEHLRQDVIGKKLKRDTYLKTIQYFNELNLWAGINFIVSLPDQTKAQMEADIEFIENLHLSHEDSAVSLNALRIYPGTRLETEARKRGVLKDGFSWLDERKMVRYSPGNLPGLYGIVPLYIERLSVVDIFSALFRWKYSRNFRKDPGKSSSLVFYLWLYVRQIRSFKHIAMLFGVSIAWLKVILMKTFRKPVLLRGQ